jgi:hypothetical protein
VRAKSVRKKLQGASYEQRKKMQRKIQNQFAGYPVYQLRLRKE